MFVQCNKKWPLTVSFLKQNDLTWKMGASGSLLMATITCKNTIGHSDITLLSRIRPKARRQHKKCSGTYLAVLHSSQMLNCSRNSHRNVELLKWQSARMNRTTLWNRFSFWQQLPSEQHFRHIVGKTLLDAFFDCSKVKWYGCAELKKTCHLSTDPQLSRHTLLFGSLAKFYRSQGCYWYLNQIFVAKNSPERQSFRSVRLACRYEQSQHLQPLVTRQLRRRVCRQDRRWANIIW